MSLAIVNKKIDDIYKKGFADEGDIQALVTAAERSQKGKSDGVSNAEARAVADFFVRVRSGTVGKGTPAVEIRGNGMALLNSFFVAHHLPYGANTRPMMELIVGVLKNVTLQALDTKPRTGSLQPVKIADDRVAYVDAVKKQVVVKAPDGFYGPVQLPELV